MNNIKSKVMTLKKIESFQKKIEKNIKKIDPNNPISAVMALRYRELESSKSLLK